MRSVERVRRTIRSLHLYSGNMYGGVETVLATLARHPNLVPDMQTEYGLCFRGRLSHELTEAGATVHHLGEVRISRPASVLRARGVLRALLRAGHFDTVSCHSTWTQTIFGPVVREFRIPLVFWLHDAAAGTSWLDRLASRVLPDLAICNSRFTAGTLQRIYRDIPIEVVHCPVGMPDAELGDQDRLRLRHSLETPDDAVVIIQVSRMEECKGHRLHLEALARIRDVPGWVCWQVGGAQRPAEARYMKELRDAAVALGIGERVRFLGQRTDVASLLRASDIFCQPNTGPDAFGITFVEALYASLPVVTTALGGGQEIVDASCGRLVPPGDAQRLADHLSSLIRDPELRFELGQNGPSRAQRLSDPGRQMLRLYEAFASAANLGAESTASIPVMGVQA